MPFPLPDVKRSYGRSGSRGGAPDIRPYLLIGRELDAQRPRLAAAIDWFQQHAGKPRSAVSQDNLALLVGDYRLARCLASCLQASFAFRAVPFERAVAQAVGARSRGVWHRLQELNIDSASALRLHVFDAANRLNGGYVEPAARLAVLEQIAAPLECDAAQLDELLWSDAEPHEVLESVAPPPEPDELAAHYNRRALETLLVRCLSADLLLPSPDGAAIRRVYFAVKRAGLLCELSLQDPDRGPRGGVWAHLFGPLEVFGPRTRHGDRFARAVLELIRAFPELEGTARVLVNEREYVLRLPRGLAEAISRTQAAADGAPDERDAADAEQLVAVVRSADDGARFDSAIERHLYQTLRGMERKGDSHGWLVEREPEPIVHGPTVLVPDFALTRKTSDPAAQDETRVFVEVIGFWTPAYRERKKAKLLELGGLVDMVLVVQDTLAPDFESLPYSVLPYKRRPSAYELIMLLEREYPAAPTPGRPRVRTPVPADESVRREWEALFGSPSTASPSPAARDTPAVG